MCTPRGIDRLDWSRWQAVLAGPKPLLRDVPAVRRRYTERVRRTILEVDAAIRRSPGACGLHLLMARLHLAGDDDLARSPRVAEHARRAAALDPDDADVLESAGDALACHGLAVNSIHLWREGVDLQRRARALLPRRPGGILVFAA